MNGSNGPTAEPVCAAPGGGRREAGRFTLEAAQIPLPRGAFPGGERHVLRFGEQPVAAVTVGEFRPFLHPVWSPGGYVVTAERPADHPHHSGIWCAADHVALAMDGPDRIERYDYNFYVDAVFQGRAPGRIRMVGLTLAAQSGQTAVIEQRLEWIGPAEWGAPDGRPVLAERRTTTVTVRPEANVLDIACELSCAGERPVTIGPTRHAFFNARLADGITLADTAVPADDRGNRGAAQIAPQARWVGFAGPVGGGHAAGLVVAPHDTRDIGWFASDWGVITAGPMKAAPLAITPGGTVRLGCRFVVHDGAVDMDRLAHTVPIPPAAPTEEGPS